MVKSRKVVIDNYHAPLGQWNGRFVEKTFDGMTGTVVINDQWDTAEFIPDDPDELPTGFGSVLFQRADVDDYNDQRGTSLQSVRDLINQITR